MDGIPSERTLILRCDKIAWHWFGRVVPHGFFSVQDGALRFHDLPVDIGLVGASAYDVGVESAGRRAPGDGQGRRIWS